MRNRTRTRLTDAGSSGRAKNGRFAKGNRIGVGNPSKSRQSRIKKALDSACTDDDVAAVIAKAVEQARKGSHVARRFLVEYLHGKPRIADASPIKITDLPSIRDGQSAVTALAALVERVSSGEINADEALRVARLVTLVRRAADDANIVMPINPGSDVPDPTFL